MSSTQIKKTNTIKYSGNASIKILNGKKIVKSVKQHNAGTPWFFQVLASAVIGNNESRNMPHYIDVLQKRAGSDPIEYDSLITNRIALTSKSFRAQEGGWIAIMSAVIPYRSLKSTAATQNIDRVDIYSGSTGSNLLASVILTDGDVIEIAANTKNNIAVEWDMSFTNI